MKNSKMAAVSNGRIIKLIATLIYNRMIGAAKLKHYSAAFGRARSDSRKTWEIARHVTGHGRVQSGGIGEIRDCKDNQEKASAFNKLCVLSVCISTLSQPTVYTGLLGDARYYCGGIFHRKGESLLHVDHITSQSNLRATSAGTIN
jgi:hypothetical protein